MSNTPEFNYETNGPGPQSPAATAPRLPYQPALDGLRALAVMAVLLYHANLAWIPGGFLGVEMFFVISGYLITSLLLAEWEEAGRIDFKSFWVRRARRLFPALFLLLAGVSACAIIFLPSEVAALRGDVLSTAGYVNNWYQVFSHKSYFESVGRPSLLRHMWSLAVEEQFYLVWPVLFSLLLARLRPRFVLMAVLGGAVASMLLMAVLYQPNTDPSRVYYGTDTRAAGILLGVALAFFWRPGQGGNAARGWLLDGIGLAAFATMVACFGFINEFQSFLYRGGFSLVGLATAELIAVAVHPRARLVPRALSWSPLRWIGVRSYGIYLWHFPVFMLTRPQLDVPMNGLPLLALRFIVTMVVAELSYRFLETPVRHGALGRSWQAWRAARGREKLNRGLRWAGAAVSITAVFSTLGIFLANARPPAPPEYLGHTAIVPAKESATTNSLATPAPNTHSSSQLVAKVVAPVPIVPPPATNAPAASVVPPPLPKSASPVAAAHETSVTAIGDSVMEGVAVDLKRAFGGNTIVDADQGRLPWNAPGIVRKLHAEGKIHPVVILQIGNNGFFSAEMFGQIMTELKDAQRVVVVNVKVPRQWESLNNKMLATAVKSYPNAVLVDWHAASENRPGYFWKDGLHLKPEGVRVYASLVMQAVRQ